MKLLFTTFLLSSIAFFSYGQLMDTIYFDFNNQVVDKNEFNYKRLITKMNKKEYLVTDFYKDGQLKLECTFIAKGQYQAFSSEFLNVKPFTKYAKLKRHGWYKSYYSSGAKEIERFYKKGKIAGVNNSLMENGDTIFFIVEKMPIYQGGDVNFREDINKKVIYPKEAISKKIQGRVFVQFVIDKEGNVKNAQVVRGIHPIIDNEALRVIKSCDKWTHGNRKGKPTNVALTVPINFGLK